MDFNIQKMHISNELCKFFSFRLIKAEESSFRPQITDVRIGQEERGEESRVLVAQHAFTLQYLCCDNDSPLVARYYMVGIAAMRSAASPTNTQQSDYLPYFMLYHLAVLYPLYPYPSITKNY